MNFRITDDDAMTETRIIKIAVTMDWNVSHLPGYSLATPQQEPRAAASTQLDNMSDMPTELHIDAAALRESTPPALPENNYDDPPTDSLDEVLEELGIDGDCHSFAKFMAAIVILCNVYSPARTELRPSKKYLRKFTLQQAFRHHLRSQIKSIVDLIQWGNADLHHFFNHLTACHIEPDEWDHMIHIAGSIQWTSNPYKIVVVSRKEKPLLLFVSRFETHEHIIVPKQANRPAILIGSDTKGVYFLDNDCHDLQTVKEFIDNVLEDGDDSYSYLRSKRFICPISIYGD